MTRARSYLSESGLVLEHGSHDDLFAQRGRYYDLYQRQAKPSEVPA